MKRIIFAGVMTALLGLELTAQASTYYYRGSFQNIQTSSTECDGVFDENPYLAAVYILDNNPHSTVLNFRSEQDVPGTFDQMSFVGSRGNSDVYYEKITTLENGRTEYIIEGVGDNEVLALEAQVTLVDVASDSVVCIAKAEFFGFE